MPLHHIAAAGHIGFIVFPHAYDCGRDIDNVRFFAWSLLAHPRVHWEIPVLFVQPVAVHDREMHLVRDLIIQGIINGHAGPDSVSGVLILAGNELELEIEEAFRVVLFVYVVRRFG